MYAFQGLVNNHVYALGVSGDELMAGTLGGLSVLEKGDVQVNYTTATPGLKHNWITAVVPVGTEWMVGTYGAGVLGLDRSGHFHSFEIATGPSEVNPNAMLVTREPCVRRDAGQGPVCVRTRVGRWFVIEQGLPSVECDRSCAWPMAISTSARTTAWSGCKSRSCIHEEQIALILIALLLAAGAHAGAMQAF